MSSPATRCVLVANGVNLDLLGKREPQLYGFADLKTLETELRRVNPLLAALYQEPPAELHFFQSNHEGVFLDKLGEDWQGLLLNPGAWTHTSLALADRLAALQKPFVEVHLSHLAKRESFRHHSYSAIHALGVCFGFGIHSYSCGLQALYAHFAKQKT